MKHFLPGVMLLLLPSAASLAQSREALLTSIDKDIQALEALLELSLLRIELSAGTAKFDPGSSSAFEKKSAASQAGRAQLDTFFRSLNLGNSIAYPYNILSLDKDEFDLLSLLGLPGTYYMHHADREPVYTPVQFRFLDGSTMGPEAPLVSRAGIAARHGRKVVEDGETYEEVAEEQMTPIERMIWKSSSFKETLALTSSKPLQSVTYKITLPLSTPKAYSVAPGHKTVATPYGLVTLDTFAGDKVYCTLPDTEADAITVEAYYKDGRVLSQKAYNAHTVLSEGKRETYRQAIVTLQAAREEAAAGRIHTEAELKAWMEAHPVAMDEADRKTYKRAVYTFAGPVSKVAFIVVDSQQAPATFTATYTLWAADTEEEAFVAGDTATEQLGLVDRKGAWIVPPRYNPYFRQQNRYFYWDQINDDETTYRFDPKARTLEPVPYRVDDIEVYAGKYVKIEPRVNGPIGVVDATTGKILLPMAHDFVHFKEGRFWHIRKDDREGVLDHELRTLLPPEYGHIDIQDGYFFTSEDGSRKNAYDAQGRNITRNQYDEIRGSFRDGLLLVATRSQAKEHRGYLQYKYIDTLCRVRIDAAAKGYRYPEPFSGGMAVVQDAESRRGYINTEGELAIPYRFRSAGDFYPGSKLAWVQLEDDSEALIDQQGRIVKKLAGQVYRRETSPEDRASRLYTKGGTVYNEYGEVVPDQER